MKQDYLKCKNGLKQQCPQVGNPLMQNLLVILTGAKDMDYLTDDDLNRVDLLCNVCDFFVPVEG
jgi:hypothetical protein